MLVADQHGISISTFAGQASNKGKKIMPTVVGQATNKGEHGTTVFIEK
jgi:hypothetical protein